MANTSSFNIGCANLLSGGRAYERERVGEPTTDLWEIVCLGAMSNRCLWIAHAFSSIQHSYAVPASHCRDEESCGRWLTSEGDGVRGTCGTADDVTARAVSTEGE